MKTTLIFIILSLLIPGVYAQSASPVPAEKLFVSPRANSFSFSPNGRFISLELKDEDGKHFSIINTQTKTITPLFTFKNTDYLLDYEWLSAGSILLNTRVNRRTVDVLIELTFDGDKISIKAHNLLLPGYVVSPLPSDPENLLFAKKVEGEFGHELYKMPIDNLRLEKYDRKYRLKNLPSKNASYAFDEELQRLILIEYDFAGASIQFKYKQIDDQRFIDLFTINLEESSFKPLGFISDTKLAVISDKDSDKKVLYEFDIPSQSFTKVLYEHPIYDIVSANVSQLDENVESVSFYDHGQLSTIYFDDANEKQSQLLQEAFPNQQYVVVAEHANTKQKVIKTFASHLPGRYYHFEEALNKAELLYSQYEGLDAYTFDKSEQFVVTAQDGVNIESILTRPQGYNLNSLIVMPHGGPIGVREYDVFNAQVQYYVSRGFSVLRVNFRGSSGFGKAFLEQGIGQFGKLIEQDISLAVDKVMTTYKFDNVCAMGASYGGYSSFMLAIKHPQTYQCIVGAFGVYDLPLLFNSSNIAVLDEMRERTEKIVGKQSDALLEVSPVYLAQKVMAPSLLIAGEKDKVAAAEHTKRMEFMLQQRGKEVTGVYYRNIGHGHTNWWGDWHQNALTYQFLLETLGLPQIDMGDVAQSDIDLIAQEYMRLGYSFNRTSDLYKDDKRAYQYFLLAANLGDARAMYNVAWYLDYDNDVPNDYEKALSLYQQSAKAGYGNANLRVGDFYYEGKGVAQDYGAAFAAYQEGLENGARGGAYAKVARAHCLGRGTPKDVTQCSRLLSFKTLERQAKKDKNGATFDNQSYDDQSKVMADIFLQGEYTQQEYSELHAMVKSEYELDLFEPVVDEEYFGVVTYNENGQTVHSGKTEINTLQRITIGATFQAGSGFTVRRNNKRFALVAQWVLINKDQSTQVLNSSFLWGDEADDWLSRYTLNKALLDAEQITLTVYDLFSKPLYTKQFFINNSVDTDSTN